MTASIAAFESGRRCRRPRLLFIEEHARGRHDHGAGHGRGRGRRGHAFGPLFAGGRKAARGDIRAAILALLQEEPKHGYQIIREIAERSDDVWRPSPGSVYPTLAQLEDEQLVRPAAGDGGRRVFELTESGREEAAKVPPAPWEQLARTGDELSTLRDLVASVAAATVEVARAGTGAQVESAKEILQGTRRSLYRLLAEDDAPRAD